jgi:hypothetical protein
VAARVLDESDVSHFPISRGLMGVVNYMWIIKSTPSGEMCGFPDGR